MLCDLCKKNEATVHLTQIVENKMQTIDLCEACSKSKGLDDPAGFSLASLLMGMGATPPETEPKVAETEDQCPKCGFTVADFKKSGRLGCANCYTTFAEPLQPLLKSMHKGIRHTGKTPHGQHETHNWDEQLRRLQKELQEAIKTENFEQAAILRDEMKSIREKMSKPAAP